MSKDVNGEVHDCRGGLLQVHPVKQALRDLGSVVPGVPCGDSRATCSMIACPGGRCVELGDKVKERVAEMLGVEEVPCFDRHCECTDGKCLALSDDVRRRFGLPPREK